jgi:hypothetical protein
MQLLGHSNIGTTLVYLHMQSPDKLNITSPIDSLEASPAPATASMDASLFPPSSAYSEQGRRHRPLTCGKATKLRA